MKPFFRAALLIFSITVVFFLFLLCGLEVLARSADLPSPDPGSDLHWMAHHAEQGVTLDDPSWFTIDEHGIQVANWLTPGTNELGYRTPPFDEPANGRPSVLLLGDSFTWGVDARPQRLSYADRLRDTGYKVVNLGIPGAGPMQYEAQARLYLPSLKPDAVCVLYYAGNDWMPEPPIRPVPARWYETNAGMLYALAPDGVPLSIDEAVARRTSQCPFWLTPRVARSMYNFALVRLAAARSDDVRFRPGAERTDVAAVERIRDLAASHGVKFYLFIVPVRASEQRDCTTTEFTVASLASCTPRVRTDFTEADYCALPDCHFNNAGHGKMAEFIATTLVGEGLHPKVEARPPDTDLYLVERLPHFDAFSAALQLDAQQVPAVRMAIARMLFRTKTLFGRVPAEGGPSPIAHYQELLQRDAQTAREMFLEYTRTVSVPGMGMAFDGAAEQYAIAAYREVAAKLRREQCILLKRIPLDRFAALHFGTDALLGPANGA